MSELVVLVPVLKRPHRVAPTLESIQATVPGARTLFIPDPDDDPERAAIRACGADELPVEGGYARKINAGVAATSEPLLFLGADDLDFKPGWFEAATAKLREGAEVVGVNDLVQRPHRTHATHFLMTRAYAERPTIDGSPGDRAHPLHEGYTHWFIDDELIATARHRGKYAYAPEAMVEHMHYAGGKAPDDETYFRGREHRFRDQQLFRGRESLWA